jgi:hypothetical protein
VVKVVQPAYRDSDWLTGVSLYCLPTKLYCPKISTESLSVLTIMLLAEVFQTARGAENFHSIVATFEVPAGYHMLGDAWDLIGCRGNRIGPPNQFNANIFQTKQRRRIVR